MKELAAVIVETRPLENLNEIINDHLKFLPKETQLYFLGSEQSRTKLKNVGKDYIFENVGEAMNWSIYNSLLTSKKFWEEINEEKVLIFQHDSMILRSGIEEFYKWDYVGAPWRFQSYGGNGGFSFRKKTAMLNVLKDAPTYNKSLHGNEDIYYSNFLPKIGYLAPRDICERFSCESIFRLGTFGCHAIDKWLIKEECEQIVNQYK